MALSAQVLCAGGAVGYPRGTQLRYRRFGVVKCAWIVLGSVAHVPVCWSLAAARVVVEVGRLVPGSRGWAR